MNYFSSLPFRRQIEQLGTCRLLEASEFNGVEKLRGKKIVIVGCGAQGLNQGLNLRDSGLDVAYALREGDQGEATVVRERDRERIRGRHAGDIIPQGRSRREPHARQAAYARS